MKKFTIRLVILALLLVLAALLLHNYAPSALNPYAGYIILYLFGITWIAHLILAQIKQDSDAWDVNKFFMLSNTVSLLGSAIFLFIYLFLVKTDRSTFVWNFFTVYFTFKAFDVRTLISNLRPHFKKHPGE